MKKDNISVSYHATQLVTEDKSPKQPSYSGLFSLGSSLINEFNDRA